MDSKNWDEISDKYYDEVISPLKNSINKPLFEDLKKFKGKNLKVIELGCGIGEMVPTLEEHFGEVTVLDFSPKMVEIARERNKNAKKTKFLVRDMTDLSEFAGQFDVAVAVNSFLASDMVVLSKMINQAASVLKPGGVLLAIIPSIESYIYQHMIYVDRRLKLKPQNEVFQKAADKFNHKVYDPFNGIIDFEDGKQKAFYRFEIWYRFGKEGFENFKIDTVLYSWKSWSEAGHVYYPKEAEPWDWYFSCEKKK